MVPVAPTDPGGGGAARSHKTDATDHVPRWQARGGNIAECVGQLTPSFFCRLEDDVVYWNTSRLSG